MRPLYRTTAQLVTLFALLTLLPATDDASARTEVEKTIDMGDYHTYEMGDVEKDDEITIRLNSVGVLDMYLLSPDQLSDYRADRSFSEVESREGTQNWWWGDISVDYKGELIFVVDNRDNGRSDDTIPFRNASYELTFYINDGSDTEMILCCVVLPIVTVVLVVVGSWQFMKMRKRKKDQERARDYSMYGPGQGGGGSGYPPQGGAGYPPQGGTGYPPHGGGGYPPPGDAGYPPPGATPPPSDRFRRPGEW